MILILWEDIYNTNWSRDFKVSNIIFYNSDKSSKGWTVNKNALKTQHLVFGMEISVKRLTSEFIIIIGTKETCRLGWPSWYSVPIWTWGPSKRIFLLWETSLNAGNISTFIAALYGITATLWLRKMTLTRVLQSWEVEKVKLHYCELIPFMLCHQKKHYYFQYRSSSV